MTDRVIQATTFALAVAALLVAGVFFAFSNFVMPALARLPGDRGWVTMNSINVTVINPWFMTLLFGTAIVGIGLTALLFIRGGGPSDWPLPVATVLYVVGCVLITMVCNVPLNDALAACCEKSAAMTGRWQHYVTDWTWWNTVRFTASCASGILYILASTRRGL